MAISKMALKYLCMQCCDKRGLSFNGMADNEVGRKYCYDCGDNSDPKLHTIMINENNEEPDEKEERERNEHKINNPACTISNFSSRVCELGTKGCTINHNTYTKKFPYTMYFKCEEDRNNFHEIVIRHNPKMPTKMGEIE